MTKEEFIKKWGFLNIVKGQDKLNDIRDKANTDILNDLDSVIATAIVEHEQSQWKPYPENKPDRKTKYLTQLIDDLNNYWIFYGDQFEDEDLNVIAFRELPTPYAP